MSLNWELKDIADWQSVCRTPEGRLAPVTEALIWTTMAVGIGDLSEKNAGEFYARMKLLRALDGGIGVYDETGERAITADEVRAHIGLWTNATTEKRDAWVKHVTARQMRDWAEEISE